MSKTLYVSDLDGTLLNTQGRISPESIRIINDLVEKGMTFTYAAVTAWSPLGTQTMISRCSENKSGAAGGFQIMRRFFL